MVINGPKDLYTIKYDSARKVCYEAPVGFWSKEDYKLYHNDYVSKIGPVVAGKQWAKVVDLRKYKPSDIVDEINVHSKWMLDNGCKTMAFIVESAIIKMQMNRAGANNGFTQQAFVDEKEADVWLKTKGF